MSNRGRHKKKSTKYPNTWLTEVMTDVQLDLLFQRAKEQNKHITIPLIEQFPCSGSILIWDCTPEGWAYWNNILDPVRIYKLTHNL